MNKKLLSIFIKMFILTIISSGYFYAVANDRIPLILEDCTHYLTSDNILNVPHDCSNIQSALFSAIKNTTVKVEPGIYYENITWPQGVDGVKLIGENPSTTIIDGKRIASVIRIGVYESPTDIVYVFTGNLKPHFVDTYFRPYKFMESNYLEKDWQRINCYCTIKGKEIRNALIQGFTIRNGYGYGPSMFNGGGGICCGKTNLTLSNVDISDNRGYNGGGILCKGGTLNLSNVTIKNNKSSSHGGGIYYSDIYVSFINCKQFLNGNGSITLSSVTISNNTAVNQGGGAYIQIAGEDKVEVDYLNFLSVNVLDNTSSYGGGITLHNVTPNGGLTLTNLNIVGNTAKKEGGGIKVVGRCYLLNSTINQNTATVGGGISGSIVHLLSNVTFSENFAKNWGAIKAYELFFNMNLTEGFNLISFPVKISNMTIKDIFPDLISAYKVNGSNITPMDVNDIVTYGEGFYIQIPDSKIYTVSGEPINSYQVTVLKNELTLIPAVIGKVTPRSTPSNVISSLFGMKKNSYFLANEIEAGFAYYIYSSEDAEIIIDNTKY